MQFHVESDSHMPVHSQPREQIRFLIRNGDLAAASRLPTAREMAGSLRIYRNTVQRAYRELVRSDQRLMVMSQTLDEAAFVFLRSMVADEQGEHPSKGGAGGV